MMLIQIVHACLVCKCAVCIMYHVVTFFVVVVKLHELKDFVMEPMQFTVVVFFFKLKTDRKKNTDPTKDETRKLIKMFSVCSLNGQSRFCFQ